MKIVLFEDREQRAGEFATAIRAILKAGTVEIFKVPTEWTGQQQTYEKRLEADIEKLNQGDATLIVADRDLSGLGQYSGLSEPSVRRVADKLGIAECGYARGEIEPYDFIAGGELREGRITVSETLNPDKFAKQVIAIADGFQDIRNRLVADKGRSRKSPGSLLASLLEKSEYADKIALYSTGDQKHLAGALKTKGTDADARLACLIGYWLWDSVLRFPGVFVNGTAASSYLDLNASEFAKPEVNSAFEGAKYKGPFHDAVGVRWWRSMLDDIVAESESATGRDLVEKKLGRPIGKSECCEEPTISAGYYCMLSGRQVSLKNSRNSLPWFPRGADLARVSKSKYDELVPWL